MQPFNERTGTTVCSHVYETLLHQLVIQIHTRRRQLLPEGALHRMLETKEMMTFDFFSRNEVRSISMLEK